MKRDLELIRKILVLVEEKESFAADTIEIDGYNFETIAFHLQLLDEAGYLKAVITEGGDGEICGAWVSHLTWEGYEFLELSRNDTVWQKSKKMLKEKAVSISVAVLTDLLKSIVKETLGLSGLPGIDQRVV